MMVVDLIARSITTRGVAVTGDPNVFDTRIRGERLTLRQRLAGQGATAAPIRNLRTGEQRAMVAAACRVLEWPRSWLRIPMLVCVRT